MRYVYGAAAKSYEKTPGVADPDSLYAAGRISQSSLWRGLTLKKIVSPTNVLLLADTYSDDGEQIYAVTRSGYNMSIRHNRRINMTFADGHAANLAPSDVFSAYTAADKDYTANARAGFNYNLNGVHYTCNASGETVKP